MLTHDGTHCTSMLNGGKRGIFLWTFFFSLDENTWAPLFKTQRTIFLHCFLSDTKATSSLPKSTLPQAHGHSETQAICLSATRNIALVSESNRRITFLSSSLQVNPNVSFSPSFVGVWPKSTAQGHCLGCLKLSELYMAAFPCRFGALNIYRGKWGIGRNQDQKEIASLRKSHTSRMFPMSKCSPHSALSAHPNPILRP